MSQFNDTGTKAFRAAGTIPQFARVTLGSGGTITASAATEQHIGFATRAAVSGDVVDVALRTKSGSQKAIAAGEIAAGAVVYTAADGEVNDVQATDAFECGIALEGAGADQDIIEIMVIDGETAGS